MPTVTFFQRVCEVLPLVETDLRVQVHFSAPPHDLGDGLARLAHGLGISVLPWERAVRTDFDLALAAGPTGLDAVRAPVITMPHGAGFQKRRRGGHGLRVPGLCPEDILLPGGRPPAAVALPHRDDLDLLARSCPEALPAATVVGDPVRDRIAHSLRRRRAYRRALGLLPGQKLVVLPSTWGPCSSFARIEALLPRLLTELPADRYRVAVLIHPNAWAVHGPYQLRAWLRQLRRRGGAVVPPEDDWRPVLIAADWIVGDHGSVTVYATLTGRPMLLAASPVQEINPHAAAAELAHTAPALTPSCPLTEQLRHARAEYRPERYRPIAARISSEPGRFGRNMRRLLYRTLGLGEPAHPVEAEPLPLPPSLDAWAAAGRPPRSGEATA
ncbi:hypothetical protein [Streptomyces sp. YIM 98790]|uniref:hypothetical protein n=1 Tax=Streptomyces sp. YIM 98790 TaxID=2689077 RepID=UPI0028BD98C4|nr:hypothetical protein [Streptomyces sp. YIM 98790]